MPPMRPAQWLIHSPVAILPWLAAVFIQGPPDEVEPGFRLPEFLPLVQRHWYWMAVALGLGVWVGCYTAADRALHGDPDDAETGEGA